MIHGRAFALMAAAWLGGACAHATPARPVLNPHATRTVPLGDGIALPAGVTITSLPAGQRFRFVSPDSLAYGLTSEDVASASGMMALRENLRIVLRSQRWTESEDSAAYDVAVFAVRRTLMVSVTREQPVVSSPTSNLPRCDLSRGGNQPPCTNEPNPRTRTVRVVEPRTTARVIHVIRRRADGAVRYWVHGADAAPGDAIVSRDLLRLFSAPEG